MAKKSPGSVLKSKGLIPRDWDLKNLSRGQKSWVTKQSRTFKDVLKSPGEFTTISAKSKRHKDQARAAGLPVSNGRAVVKVGAGGHARRRGDKIVISNPQRRMDVWFATGKNFKRTIANAHKRKLKPNQVWAFNVGYHTNHVQYKNLDDMLHYLDAKDDWHSPDATEHVSLVLITENRRHIIARLGEQAPEEGEDE